MAWTALEGLLNVDIMAMPSRTVVNRGDIFIFLVI